MSAWRARTNEHDQGSLTVFVAVISVSLMLFIGLVVDAGRALSDRMDATAYAQEAARAGAAQISTDALRAGQVVVASEPAIRAADGYLASISESGRASVSGNTVTVNVETSASTVILGMIGINRIGISVSARATNVRGVVRGD